MSSKVPVKSLIRIIQLPRTLLSPRSAQGHADIYRLNLQASIFQLLHKNVSFFFVAGGRESFFFVALNLSALNGTHAAPSLSRREIA